MCRRLAGPVLLILGPLSLEDKKVKASLSPVLLASSDSPTRCVRALCGVF